MYIRSFADSNGDGLGDVNGIRSRLPYLRDLGVDAIWINPWYPSPQADAGYDVADYRDIEPAFGTLEDGKALIAEAHELGIRVILDIVPNHSSDQHAWFQAALASPPGSPERARYLFRDGGGPDGSEPPNNWRSVFGGPAWQRITEADGSPGQWYLHLFAPEQPDFDWENPEVRAEFCDILRFWFDLGADGFRIDVAHGMVKDPAFPDIDYPADDALLAAHTESRPYENQPGVHDIYRSWRQVAEEYEPERIFVAEAWVPTAHELAAYVRADELHTTFDFTFIRTAWEPADLRARIQTSIDAHESVGAPVTWTLSNHDICRHLSRFGRPQEHRSADPLHVADNGETDVALGTTRARAAILLLLALPGAIYLYQGEELGLPEVEDLPDDVLQDPIWLRSGHTNRGRDGCRVPLPWTATGSSLGFGSNGSWLPQPTEWTSLAAEVQDTDPGSMLNLYRRALRIRREELVGSEATMAWVDLGSDVVAFDRGDDLRCVINLGSEPCPLPDGEVVLSSGDLLDDGRLIPTDVAVWLRPG
ncbi:MAG: glycoside hydrolase family 13 protein [Ilumatobacteraceae bacterium]